MILLYTLAGIVLLWLLWLISIIFLPVLKCRPLTFQKKIPEFSPPPENRKNISFFCEGEKISAWYYTPPEGSAPWPCIILSHGFAGTKDCLLEGYALEFNKMGLAALSYDYRHFGESEGIPRQLYSAEKQHSDLTHAVRWALAEKSIDSEKIFLWGTSAGANYGLIAASHFPEIRGVIAQCGAFDHKEDSKKAIQDQGYLFFFRLLPHGIRDKWRGRLGLSRHKIPAYGKKGYTSFFITEGIFEAVEKLAEGSKHFINEVCASFMLLPHGPSPLECAKKIQCPVLFLVCEKDEIVSFRSHIRAAEILKDKAVIKIYPVSHFEIYQGEPRKKAMADQELFLKKLITDEDFQQKESV